MNIACIIHSLDGGGAERVMAGLASRLNDRGHRVTLISLDDGSRDQHAVAVGVRRSSLDLMKTSRHPLQAIWNNWRRRVRLRHAIQNVHPDVILSFCDRNNVLTLMAACSLGIPIVVAERSDPRFQPIGRGWATLRRRYYPRAAKLVALTAASAEAMRDWHAEPAAIIPSAVEPPAEQGAQRRPRQRGEARRKRLLAVGRLAPEKGFDRLIDTFAELAGRHPDWDLAIAGEGQQGEALQRQIAQHGLENRVELLGWQRDIQSCYAAADLFVSSSRYEGFPSALLEAMACGLACLAIDCESGPREIIRSDVDGVLVPQEPPHAFTQQLDRLMSDSTTRERLGRVARDVSERFDWDTMVTAYEEVLRGAVEEDSAAAFSSAALGRK